MIIKLILCIINLLIIPELLGLLIAKCTNAKNNIFLAFVQGYLLEFAIFEIIYVPMYFAKVSFKVVFYSWTILILILSMISLIVNRKNFKKIAKTTITTIKTMPKMLSGVFCVFLTLQIVVPILYMQNVDPDDAFYLATINTTIQTNSLFQYDAYDGKEYEELPLRYSLSGLLIYYAILSQLTNIHPAIFIHTIWPTIAILLEFIVYAFLGNVLFKNNKENVAYFLIFLSIIYIFGFCSIYINFSFFAYRSWQGKALIGNLIIPMVWLYYFYCTQYDKIINWILLFCTMIAACFVTEMGVFLAPFALGILAIINSIQCKKFKNLFRFGCCFLPQLIVGILYLTLS